MTVLAVSDTHLGYERANASEFLAFLEYVSARSDVETLVILGDFVDMWRRDVSGLFLEEEKIIRALVDLGKKTKIVFIAGNHDYHLLQLRGPSYPFLFEESKLLPATDTVHYKFKHGYEYDPAQNRIMMELLCHNMSNKTGQERSKTYQLFVRIKEKILGLLGISGKSSRQSHLMQVPEVRLEKTLPDVERRAFEDLGKDEILVFGHTHRAFVSEDGKVVNTGCWVSDAALPNTFVELNKEQVRLFRFFSSDHITEITERLPVQR